MGAIFSGRILVNNLMDLIDWVSQSHRQEVVSNYPIDAFQQEIHQIEKTLADTQPTRIIRKIKPLEPITEQQKIIDLAG